MKAAYKEILWILGIAGVAFVAGALLCPHFWMGAVWVWPLPQTGGPVWINLHSPILLQSGLFLLLLIGFYLIRFILRRLSRRHRRGRQGSSK